MPSLISQVFVLGVLCWGSRVYSGWFCRGGLCSGYFVGRFVRVGGFCPVSFVRGRLCPGGFVRGGFVRVGFVRVGFVRVGFVRVGFVRGGGLSGGGGFVRRVLSGGFCPGGFARGVLPGGFCPGGFVRGFCPGGFVRGVLFTVGGKVCPSEGFVQRCGVLSRGFCPGVYLIRFKSSVLYLTVNASMDNTVL